MGPKKEVVVEEPVKIEEPVIPPHQLAGFGRFEYVNGSIYEGAWRLVNGVKAKHGQGLLTVPGTGPYQIGKEKYQGSWQNDAMNGFGVYHYAGGAIYRGEWKDNKQDGKGVYEFPNGTIYEGQWRKHLMHGTGLYVDASGKKWQGEFREGMYDTQRQKELRKEKQLTIKKAVYSKEVEKFVQAMVDAVAKSDKKTLKENFSPFFAVGDVIKEQIKEPYSKFDERPADKWTELLNHLKGGKFKVLGDAKESEVLGADRIIAKQLEGPGQVVEVIGGPSDKPLKAAFVTVDSKSWICVAVKE